jgi:ABC-type multidrug transport system ATPase subunit
VLDEPTNHLDLESRESLLEALQKYEGTLIFVSHDRHFVSHLAGRILALSPEGVEDFSGSYEQYLEKQGADYLAVPQGRTALRQGSALRSSEGAASSGGNGSAAKGSPAPAVVANEERKARQRDVKRIRKQVHQVEGRIAGLEETLAGFDKRFAQPEYFQATPWDQVQAAQRQRKEAQSALDATLAEWTRLAGELEAHGEAEG